MAELTRDKLPEGWDETSQAYDKVVFPMTSRYAANALAMLEVREGHTLLDVAAGSGAATMQAVGLGAEVVATDFAPMMVERLRHRLSDEGATNVETMVMDGQDLRFADETFDRAISVFGLIFFPDRVKGLSEMHRVLKPAGRAAVVSWAAPEKTWPLAIWGETLREVLPDLPTPPEPPAVYSLSDPDRLRDEMSRAGFKDIEIRSIVNTFDDETPEGYWDDWHNVSPVFTTLTSLLGDRMGEYRDRLVAKVRERFGDGPIRAEAEALVALGTK